MDHVTYQVGRYPFYLQMAFYFLFEAYRSNLSEAHRLELVDWNFLAEAHPHLEGYWQYCTERQKTVLTLLALLDGEDAKPLASWPAAELEQWFKGVSIPLDDLERRGLATRVDNQYSLISKAFARWILKEVTTPSAEESAVEDRSLGTALVSLPDLTRQRVTGWVNQTDTLYRSLFVKWG